MTFVGIDSRLEDQETFYLWETYSVLPEQNFTSHSVFGNWVTT